MSTENQTFDQAAAEAQGIDPILQENLDDVSTVEPLLPKNDYTLEVVKIFQARNKADTGNMIKVELKTVKDHQAVTGETVPAGRRLFGQIVITPSEKMNADAVKRNLKRFQVACGGKGSFFPLEQYVGCRPRVKVRISKPTDEYPDERNEIASFV